MTIETIVPETMRRAYDLGHYAPAAKANGFNATSNYSQISQMDAIIICVPTPLNEYHEPDLSYITDTAKSVAPHLRAGQIVTCGSYTGLDYLKPGDTCTVTFEGLGSATVKFAL